MFSAVAGWFGGVFRVSLNASASVFEIMECVQRYLNGVVGIFGSLGV